MSVFRTGWMCGLLCVQTALACAAQPHDPQIGYIYPPGAQAGATIDVKLGGFNWTDDLEVFVHNRRVKLEIIGRLGPLFMQTPPYFVGNKAYYPSPMPRELSARLTLPADLPPGPIHWQVANANGTSEAGLFIIGRHRELLEDETTGQQPLGDLPVTVSGRLTKNEEIDRYLIRPPETGPITCLLAARKLGGQFHGVLEVRDAEGHIIADAADTRGTDIALTYLAQAGREYTLSVRELDFRGNRAFVYRLSVSPQPHILAAVPATGRRGESREIDLIGYAIQTGSPKLERLRRTVKFPDDGRSSWFLKTPGGAAEPFALAISNFEEYVYPQLPAFEIPQLPAGVTGVIHKRGELHRYRFSAAKDEVWSLAAKSQSEHLPLDLTLTLRGPEGKVLAENDDLPGTTNAGLLWTVPQDGVYELAVADQSGHAGEAAAYRLVADRPRPDFELRMPRRHNIPQGEKAELTVTVIRRDGFQGAIEIKLAGLPGGVSVPENMTLPADKKELKISLTASATVPVSASLVTVTGISPMEEGPRETIATSPGIGGPTRRILIATTMKPRIAITPVESDERTVRRGTMHLAPVATKRQAGFTDPLVVRMDAYQPFKFRQGFLGLDTVVPAGAERVFYPLFVPERAETIDTYRMLLIAAAQVPDVDGRVRQLISRMPAPDNTLAMSVEGGPLKLALDAQQQTIRIRRGQPFEIPLRISRSADLTTPIRVEVVTADHRETNLSPSEIIVAADRSRISVRVVLPDNFGETGEKTVLVRALTQQPANVPQLDVTSETTPRAEKMRAIINSGHLPVIAEIRVPVEFVADSP